LDQVLISLSVNDPQSAPTPCRETSGWDRVWEFSTARSFERLILSPTHTYTEETQ